MSEKFEVYSLKCLLGLECADSRRGLGPPIGHRPLSSSFFDYLVGFYI